MTTASILISSIRRDGGTQIRAALDEATVNEYAEAYRARVTMPPLVVFFDGTDNWLGGGFHRVAAAQRAGIKRLPADVRSGNLRDAIKFAVGDNAEHGLKRSNSDKRNAVLTLLRDAEWRKNTDRWVAAQAKVSHTFVAELRQELRGATSEQSRTFTAPQSGNVATECAKSQPSDSLSAESCPPTNDRAAGAGDGSGGDEGAGAVGHGPRVSSHSPGTDAPAPNAPKRSYAHLEDAFAAFDNHLRSAQAALATLLGDESVAADVQALRQAAHDLAARARQTVRPAGDCLYCKDANGEAGRRENCNGCHGRGWLTADQLEAVPRELAGSEKVVDAERGGFVPKTPPAPPGWGGQAKHIRIEDEAGNELVVERDDDEEPAGW